MTLSEYPPRADQVAGCPPHYWLIKSGWQSCKKCGASMEVPSPAPWSSAGFGQPRGSRAKEGAKTVTSRAIVEATGRGAHTKMKNDLMP